MIPGGFYRDEKDNWCHSGRGYASVGDRVYDPQHIVLCDAYEAQQKQIEKAVEVLVSGGWGDTKLTAAPPARALKILRPQKAQTTLEKVERSLKGDSAPALSSLASALEALAADVDALRERQHD